MRDFETVAQFQFIQNSSGDYTIKLATLPAYRQEEVIRKRMLEILGADAQLTFKYVDEIPPIRSGKRPYILNRMSRPADDWKAGF